MKLGGKSKDTDLFVDKLRSEGEVVATSSRKKSSAISKTVAPSISKERYVSDNIRFPFLAF